MRTPWTWFYTLYHYFIWSLLITSFFITFKMSLYLAASNYYAIKLIEILNTSFFWSAGGGVSYFIFNIYFEFFGHPEVYILILPGFGINLSMLLAFIVLRPIFWLFRYGLMHFYHQLNSRGFHLSGAHHNCIPLGLVCGILELILLLLPVSLQSQLVLKFFLVSHFMEWIISF